MVIRKEYRSLLEQVSLLNVSIREKVKEKEQFEELIERELCTLKNSNADALRELTSLRDQGILYCNKCNDLYEMSETRLERKEGMIVVDVVDVDLDRSRYIYAKGVELRYYCQQCNSHLAEETRRT